MSKMSELDADRQRIERLTDVVLPPTFAQTKNAGTYREITRAEINAFLRSAVILAMAKPEYINGGVRVIDATMINDSLRLQIDNGDILYLDFEHLVPRDASACGGYQPQPGPTPSLPTTGSGVRPPATEDIAPLKVELASRNLRITGLEETLKATRDQLIKVRDADPEIRSHQLETNQTISRAWHMLNFGGRP